MITSRVGATPERVDALAVQRATITHAKTTPMTMPRNAPSRAMITDSHRTSDRTCLRVIRPPRMSPSSRVRSMIEKPSVLAMPKSAMKIAKSSSA